MYATWPADCGHFEKRKKKITLHCRVSRAFQNVPVATQQQEAFPAISSCFPGRGQEEQGRRGDRGRIGCTSLSLSPSLTRTRAHAHAAVSQGRTEREDDDYGNEKLFFLKDLKER